MFVFNYLYDLSIIFFANLCDRSCSEFELNISSWFFIFFIFFKNYAPLIFIPYPNIFLTFTFLLFLIGLSGLLFFARNMFSLLLCFEIISLSLILDFIYVSFITQTGDGFVFSLMLLGLAAVESTVGLAFILLYFKRVGFVNTKLRRFFY